MRKKLVYILLYFVIGFIVSFGFTSCKKDKLDSEDLIGNWIQKSDFEGVPRSEAVAFCIGNKGYLATGYDGEDRLNDLWQYDPDKDFWVQKASLPGKARSGAIGFGTDSKGYIGTGYDGNEKLSDFWEYDPVSNTWVQKANFAGTPRYAAIGLAINNLGYVGTGYDGSVLKDFWQYNPQTDQWIQKVSVGGSKRRDALAFAINGKVYIAAGVNNGEYVDDFWEYDPISDIWLKLRDISDASDDDFDDEYKITRTNAVAFTINDKAYIATAGEGTVGNDVWEYDPLYDLWEEKASFEGSARIESAAFSINNQGYIITGRNSSYYFDDMWTFKPDDENDEND